MTTLSSPALRRARATLGAALLAAAAACGDQQAAAPVASTIDRETFIATYVDLRTATIRSGATVISDEHRASILARHGVTEEDLLAFAEIRGTDVEFMRGVWDEVETRLDGVRVAPDSDQRR